jgi:hypothetical protein
VSARHTCHAHGCDVAVPPKMFMCRGHWYSLPKELRDAIWNEYTPGQERSKTPSLRYLAVQQYAICRAAFKPNDEAAAVVCARYLQKALYWQEQAIKAGDGDPLEGLVPAEPKS